MPKHPSIQTQPYTPPAPLATEDFLLDVPVEGSSFLNQRDQPDPLLPTEVLISLKLNRSSEGCSSSPKENLEAILVDREEGGAPGTLSLKKVARLGEDLG